MFYPPCSGLPPFCRRLKKGSETKIVLAEKLTSVKLNGHIHLVLTPIRHTCFVLHWSNVCDQHLWILIIQSCGYGWTSPDISCKNDKGHHT